jgi:hypothetical protein
MPCLIRDMSYSIPRPDHPSLDGIDNLRVSFDVVINSARFLISLAQNLPSSVSRRLYLRSDRLIIGRATN